MPAGRGGLDRLAHVVGQAVAEAGGQVLFEIAGIVIEEVTHEGAVSIGASEGAQHVGGAGILRGKIDRGAEACRGLLAFAEIKESSAQPDMGIGIGGVECCGPAIGNSCFLGPPQYLQCLAEQEGGAEGVGAVRIPGQGALGQTGGDIEGIGGEGHFGELGLRAGMIGVAVEDALVDRHRLVDLAQPGETLGRPHGGIDFQVAHAGMPRDLVRHHSPPQGTDYGGAISVGSTR